MPRFVLVLLAAAFLSWPASRVGAQTPSDTTAHNRHEVTAPSVRVAHATEAIRVDGVLDEAAWSAAEPVTEFTQLDPEEGKPSSERTEVRIILGDDALYVGARLFDREAGKLQARLARRDDPTQSDAFEVSIDSYHDHLTARRFRVSPAGAIYDALVGADGNTDASWDAVWEANAKIDGQGWTAEMRIPLSQLRYHTEADATWGLQLMRFIFRRGEYSYFAFTPKKEQGGVSRYGHLVGLGRLPEPRRLELLPYATARNERLHFADGDPFRSPDDVFGGVGGDVKYGLTSDLTLDLALNPDFGQVEVDPAEVNLSATETFYPERRSFFVEGADLFSFGRSRAYNNFGVPIIFHSRRIGREPQRVLRGRNYSFVDVSDKTTIGGAAKLTGRTAGGWAIGVIDAVTLDEDARFLDTLGVERETPVEPLTHYLAGRVRKDLRRGDTSVGALVTSTNRDLENAALHNLLRTDAYTMGLDLAHAWSNRTWAIDGDVTASEVRGSPSSIAVTQTASSRYYQRPDHGDYARFDPARTRLSGYGFDGSFSKLAGTHWLYSVAYDTRSPGYETNEVGYETRADFKGLSTIVLYNQNTPGKWFRSYSLFPFANQMWNYGGDRVFDAIAFDANGQFANYWTFDTRYTLNRRAANDALTRGGPQALSAQSQNVMTNFGSDPRRSWTVSVNYTHSSNEFGGLGDTPSLAFSFRPSPTLRFRFEPSLSATHGLAQFVGVVPDPDAALTYGRRYLFATLDQRVVSLVTRLDWTLSPRLSLQLYVQPLVVSAGYSDFKEFRAPGTYQFDVYGKHRGTIARDTLGIYTIDPGNGRTFAIPDPNFNFRSLLGNAVVRWEYRPGSTLYFVWQQSRTGVDPIGDFEFGRDYRELFEQTPENVFAIKATWWVGL